METFSFKNSLKTLLFFVVLVFTLSGITYALPVGPPTAYGCAHFDLSADADPPEIIAIICPLLRVINILLFSASFIFAIMLGYAGIKLSMALGDPKGYESARLTMLYAFIGLFVVLASFTLISIVTGLFGFSITSPQSLVNLFFGNIVLFLGNFGIQFN